MEFLSLYGPIPSVPDDRTLTQFVLDDWHPSRPKPVTNTWLIDDATGRTLSFHEVRIRVHGLANGLKLKYDIQDNDVALVYSPNDIDYPIVIWALHRLGAIFSGANPTYTADELLYQAQAIKPTVLIAHPNCLSTAASVAQAIGLPPSRVLSIGDSKAADVVSVSDVVEYGLSQPTAFVEPRLRPGEAKTKTAFLCFSSGTTGRPKAIPINHYSPIVNMMQVAFHNTSEESTDPEQRRFRPGDVATAVLPLYHIYGLVMSLHFMLWMGLSLVVIPKFNFENFLQSIVRHRINSLFVVPPMIVALVKHPATKKYDLSHIRLLLFGAAPISEETYRQVSKLLPQADVCQAYGMTETCTAITVNFTKTRGLEIGSAGTLCPGYRAHVVKADGTLAGCGEQGELWVHSPSNTSMYLHDEKATKETFVDGWVRTGDIGFFKENGHFFIVDRAKEMIKVRGFQVSPTELEGCLLEHPLVGESCVVGVPDEFNGELPIAFVVPAHGKDPRNNSIEEQRAIQDLTKHVADRKAPYKRLAAVVFADSIPKNPTGKMLRKDLKQTAKNIWRQKQQALQIHASAKL